MVTDKIADTNESPAANGLVRPLKEAAIVEPRAGNSANRGDGTQEESIVQVLRLVLSLKPLLTAVKSALGEHADNGVLDKVLHRLESENQEPVPNNVRELLSPDEQVRLAAIKKLDRLLSSFSMSRPDEAAGRMAAGQESGTLSNDPADYPGQWIAWTSDKKKIIAVADDFDDIMAKADALGENDPWVDMAPGYPPGYVEAPFELWETESDNIMDDLRRTIPDVEGWLDEANLALFGKKPRDMIGTPDERIVREELRRLWSGITS